VALARALATFLGRELTAETVSALAYKVEKIYHGTPSGIDNTVVAWERPVYFVKGSPPEVFSIATPFHLLIADSGQYSSTRAVVAAIRSRRDVDPSRFAAPFKRMGEITRQARIAIASGELPSPPRRLTGWSTPPGLPGRGGPSSPVPEPAATSSPWSPPRACRA
jgi:mevalonate kinase